MSSTTTQRAPVDVQLINRQCSANLDQAGSSKTDDTLRRLKAASILCLLFIIVEVVGGLLSASLAVLSDAAHLFADLASFIVAIIAARLAQVPPNTSNTFGYHRAEVLAALYSMSCLWVVSLFLAIEAIRRGYVFLTDEDAAVVDGKIMSITAAIGVVVNISLAFILGGDHHHHGHSHDHSHDHGHSSSHLNHNDHDHNHTDHDDDHHDHDEHHDHSHEHSHHNDNESQNLLANNNNDEESPTTYDSTNGTVEKKTTSAMDDNLNLKAAYLHVLADLLQSFCVFFSGLVIWYNPQWQIFDPIVTILFCIIVMKSTYGVIFSSISLLMNDVPSTINWTSVYNAIEAIDGVSNVRDLHIWSISSESFSLSVHVDAENVEDALFQVKSVCARFQILHTTIQIQPKK